jgi:hypothetical protein
MTKKALQEYEGNDIQYCGFLTFFLKEMMADKVRDNRSLTALEEDFITSSWNHIVPYLVERWTSIKTLTTWDFHDSLSNLVYTVLDLIPYDFPTWRPRYIRATNFTTTTGVISAVTRIAKGSGYTNGDILTLTLPGGPVPGGANATVTATVVNGEVQSVAQTSSTGRGYAVGTTYATTTTGNGKGCTVRVDAATGWNASTGSHPTTGISAGTYWVVNVAGTISEIHYNVGDWIYCDVTTPPHFVKSTGNANGFKYLGDGHLWFLGVACDVYALYLTYPTIFTLSTSDAAYIKDMRDKFYLWLQTKLVSGSGFVWENTSHSDNEQYRFANYTGETLPPNLYSLDYIALDVCWDTSHSSRFPVWLQGLKDSYLNDPTDADHSKYNASDAYLGRFANQIGYCIDYIDTVPVLRNYISGHNGGYRTGYNAITEGHLPYWRYRSINANTGDVVISRISPLIYGFFMMCGRDNDVEAAYLALDAARTSTNSSVIATRNTYYSTSWTTFITNYECSKYLGCFY